LAHGAELTEAGKAFLAGVKEMQLIAERATMTARCGARGETGSLRVGVIASATFKVVVPSTIRAFRRAYPDIDLTLEKANTAPLTTRLREGTLDAAFLLPGAAGTGELQARRLSEEPIMVALPKRHRAAAFEQVDLALLKDDPFFVFPPEIAPTLYDTVVDACRKAGFEPLRADHRPARTAHGVDRESRGRRACVSILPTSMMQVRVTGIAYRQIAGQSPTTQLALAYRRGATSPVVRNFIARAVSHVRRSSRRRSAKGMGEHSVNRAEWLHWGSSGLIPTGEPTTFLTCMRTHLVSRVIGNGG
jgi:DNA-binding transcriptional LysR family regulator